VSASTAQLDSLGIAVRIADDGVEQLGEFRHG